MNVGIELVVVVGKLKTVAQLVVIVGILGGQAAAQTGPLGIPDGDGGGGGSLIPDDWIEFDPLGWWASFLGTIIQGEDKSDIEDNPIGPTIFFFFSGVGFYLLVETANDALNGLFTNSNIPLLDWQIALGLALLTVSQSGYVGVMEGVFTAILLGAGITAVGIAVAFLIMGPAGALGALGLGVGISASFTSKGFNKTKEGINNLQVRQLQQAGHWLGENTLGAARAPTFLNNAWAAWKNINRCDGNNQYGGVKHLNPGGTLGNNCNYNGDNGPCNGTIV